MKRRWPVAWSAALLCLACLALPPARADENRHEVELNGRSYSIPASLRLSVAADASLASRPICGDFDVQGRIFVAEASGTNAPVQQQLAEKPHRIVCLEDVDGDGVFDRRTVFADRMMFPEGVLCHDGSVYVAAPPEIWKLTDGDGDGVAEQREVWWNGKTLTGCANDLHGPYLGRDGWIYWCKGAFAEQTLVTPSNAEFKTRAAHIFRRRPQGGLAEAVMTGGMDNPVEIVFTPAGERIFNTTFLVHPRDGLRDGLIHAIYGGVYGKEHGVLDGHPRTGPLMPVLQHMGAAAPAGLALLESDALGRDSFSRSYRHEILTCCFNMHKVTRSRLVPDGATFLCETEDLLTTPDFDFHPTDVLESPDGSLIIIDTGGWYKLCCPTSHLHKPDVLGGIYRLARATNDLDAGETVQPDSTADFAGKLIEWSQLSAAELVELIRDRRGLVRRRALELVASKGFACVGPLREMREKAAEPEDRLQAVWALCRIDHPLARQAIREAISDKDPQVAQAAVHAASAWRDPLASQVLRAVVTRDAPAALRRAAAEALGRLDDPNSTSALLAALDSDAHKDRVLEHSLIYALIELRQPAELREALGHVSPRVQSVALMALDQIHDSLQPADLEPLFESPRGEVVQAAWRIALKRPHWDAFWSRQLTGMLESLAQSGAERSEERVILRERWRDVAGLPAGQRLMAAALSDRQLPESLRLDIVGAFADSGAKLSEDVLLEAVASHVAWRRPDWLEPVLRAIEVNDQLAPSEPLRAALQTSADDSALADDLRLQALLLCGRSRNWAASKERMQLVLRCLEPGQPPRLRMLASDAVQRAELDQASLLRLASQVASAGPMELSGLVAACAKSDDIEVGRALLTALRRNPAASSLGADALEKLLRNYGVSHPPETDQLRQRLDRDNQQQRATLEEVLPLVAQGDVRNGQSVFYGNRASCGACHQLGYLGGDIGPDLNRIGQIRSERDLLESILFPSASLVRSFETEQVRTIDGRVYSGIPGEEADGVLRLIIDARTTVRLSRDEIEERAPSTVSIMPAGLDKLLTPQELADLVAFLKAAN